jgi:hypothetical protein
MHLEWRAVRRRCPQLRVVEAGIALSKFPPGAIRGCAISFGLAGGLKRDVPTGTLLIPSFVRAPSGQTIACNVSMIGALRDAARRLGFSWIEQPILTSATLVTGSDRPRWAERGFAAVDMESGLLNVPMAVLRIVLDTPRNELSPDWVDPARAALRPRNWSQMFWLAYEAPRCADRAAQVLATAMKG